MKRQSVAMSLVVAACVAIATAAEQAEKSRPESGLSVRQEHVHRLMLDLERKFVSIAQKLGEKEPERAARLLEAFQESKKLGIEGRMATIAQLLRGANLDKATGQQQQVLEDLRRLVLVLLDEEANEEKQIEIDKLLRWREQLKQLIKEQQDQLRDSDKVAHKDKALARLAQRIAQVRELIQKQQQVLENTSQARQEAIEKLPQVAGEQRQVRDDTQKLADDIAAGKLHREQPGDQDHGNKDPGNKDPGNKDPGNKDPGNKDPGNKDPGNKDPGNKDPGNKDPGNKDPGDQQPGEQPGENEPGVKPLREAAQQQQAAEKNLDQGRGKAAEKEEQGALAKLKQALKELEQEQQRLAELDPEAVKKLAEKQGQTAEKTGELADEIAQADPQAKDPGNKDPGNKDPGNKDPGNKDPGNKDPGNKDPGNKDPGNKDPGNKDPGNKDPGNKDPGNKDPGNKDPGNKDPGNKQPGQQKPVQNAQQQMKDAQKNLQQQQPGEAGDHQQQAIDDLQQALQELEERLAQLREEMQLERLARLEARFREMLAQQRKISAETLEVDKKKQAAGLKRSTLLALKKLAKEERFLAEMAWEALEIILEDGTSVVFPRIVERLHHDLNRVGERLDDKFSGADTQFLQKEIERTLEELIQALEEAQQQKQQQQANPSPPSQGQQPNQNQEEPLMPDTAELKLLKAAQLRVNRLTETFDKARGNKPLDDARQHEVKGIARLQQEIAEMTREMIERN